MDSTKQKVGKLIRVARTGKGLTQDDLGAALEVNRSVVSDYERGKQNMTLDTVDRIASALGLKVRIVFE